MENLEYKIVLDIVLAESQVDNLKQKLSDTGKEVDTVNSKGLDNLGKSAQKATQDVDNLNKALDKTKEATDKAKKAAKDAGKAANKASTANLEWGDAFTDTMLNAASSLDVASPGFRELVSQINGAIPIVKSLNLTAVKGLKGVKAAIASTGIGLLIIAVGELAANWSKVTDAVKSFIGEANWDKLTEGLSKFWDKVKGVFAGIFKFLEALAVTVHRFGSNIFASFGKILKGDLKGAWEEFREAVSFKQNWEEGLKAGEAFVQGLADIQEKNRREQALEAIAEAKKLNETRLETIKREHSERMANLDAEYKKGKFNAEEYAKIKAEYDKKYRSDLASLRTPTPETKPQASTQDVEDFQTLTEELGRITEEQLSKISDKAKEAYTTLVSVWQIGEDNKDNNAFISAEDALRDINILIQEGLIKTQNWEGIVKSLVDGERVEVDHLNDIQSSQTAILKAQRDVTENKVIQLGLDKQIAESEVKQQENVVRAIKEQINLYNKFNGDNKFTEQIFQLSNSLEEATAKLEVLKIKAANIGTKDLKSLVSSIMPKEDEATQLRKGLADTYSLLDYYREQDLVSEEEYSKLKLQARDNFLQALSDLEAKAQEEREERAREEVDKYQASLEAAQDAIDQVLSIGDGLSSKWGDAFAVLHQGFNQIAVDLKSGKKDWTTYASGAANAIGFVSQVTQALADQQDTSTEEGFEKQRKLQKVSVILSGIQGSVSAVTNAIRDLGFPAGPIVGGAMSTAILAMTAAQVAAIDRTTFEGGGSSASAGVSVTPVVSGIDESLPTQTVVTNQQDQRVYILESDIQSSNKRVKVREENTTF